MCLRKIELNLKRQRNGQFVGTGYKILPTKSYANHTDLVQVFNDKKQLTKAAERKGWSRKWMQAKGWQGKGLQHENAAADFRSNNQDIHYSPGFHIFLTKEAAQNYTHRGVIVKVEFKNVIAFGTNETNVNGASAPCVVAEYMRVVEILD
jgi:hypothetical protein